jgi:hypothetical protein
MLTQAVTSRPPAYSYILVDSTDRYPNGFPNSFADRKPSNNWKLQFSQNVSNGYIQRISCPQLVFNWNLPTIIENYNDIFYVSVNNASALPVVIEQGFYDISGLEVAIQAGIDDTFGSGVLTIQYVSTNVGFVLSTVVPATPIQVIPPTNKEQRRCLTTLGLVRTGVTGSGTMIFGAQPTMLATKYVDICSTVLTKYQRVPDVVTLPNNPGIAVLARVFPLGLNTVQSAVSDNFIANQPFTVAMDFNTPKSMSWNPDTPIQSFDIQLRDDFGDLIPDDGENSCEYQLTFLITES